MILNQKTDFTDLFSAKVAIISDTHEELDPQIINKIKECDIAIHAGDIGSGFVLKSMQPKSGHVSAVSGNNDKHYFWDQQDWDIVKNLPEQLELLFTTGKIAIEHGHRHDTKKPCHQDLRDAHPDARLVIYGHTHIQIIDEDKSDKHVINPGAAGFTRNKGGPSCIILTIENEKWTYDAVKYPE